MFWKNEISRMSSINNYLLKIIELFYADYLSKRQDDYSRSVALGYSRFSNFLSILYSFTFSL